MIAIRPLLLVLAGLAASPGAAQTPGTLDPKPLPPLASGPSSMKLPYVNGC